MGRNVVFCLLCFVYVGSVGGKNQRALASFVEDYFEPDTDRVNTTFYVKEDLPELIEKLLPVVVSVRASNIVESELKKYNSNYFYYNEIKSV
ncbi:MAG: hypothetical protein LBG48_01305, partial [Rickettsiales bacterium]|nr:hypothetical protein [Rickettsiales bacterium]